MRQRLKPLLAILGYGFAAGCMLMLFALVPGLARYAFSLAALWFGYRFFRGHSSIGQRIGFIAVAVLFYLLLTVTVSIVLYMRANPPASL